MGFWFQGSNVGRPYLSPVRPMPKRTISNKKIIDVWAQDEPGTNFNIAKGESGTEPKQWFAKPKSGYPETAARPFSSWKAAVAWAITQRPNLISVNWTTWDEKYDDNDHEKDYMLENGKYKQVSLERAWRYEYPNLGKAKR